MNIELKSKYETSWQLNGFDVLYCLCSLHLSQKRMFEGMICVISPHLFSQKFVLPFTIIGCSKGRKLLREESGIECLLTCFVFAEDRIKKLYIFGPFCCQNKIKLENCIPPNLHVGEVMAVPTTSYMLSDTNYPENTFASI